MYVVPPSGAGSNAWRAVIRMGQVGATLRNSATARTVYRPPVSQATKIPNRPHPLQAGQELATMGLEPYGFLAGFPGGRLRAGEPPSPACQFICPSRASYGIHA